MGYWVFQGRETFTMRESDTWIEGLADALNELGIDLPSVRIAAGPTGSLRVADAQGHVVALIVAGSRDQVAADGKLDTLSPVMDGLIEAFDTSLPVDETGLPADVAERLFEVSAPVDEAATDAEAAGLALDLLLGVVPAQAGAVLLAGLEQQGFEFLAARGPAAEKVRKYTLPFGQGHVGSVHDSGVALLLHDVAHSARHWHEVDAATGFAPTSLIAVPIRSSDGRSWGVIELLSTDDRMLSWHVTAADTVAATLAERFATELPDEV